MPKIAIIEDQEIDSNAMRDVILSAYPNCEIDQYFDRPSAEKALEQCKYQYDLLVVDIDLGGSPPDRYGGFTILAKLAGKPVVALVVSGKPDSNLEEMVISLNAYDFLSKPYSSAALLHAIKHALEWKPFVAEVKNDLGFSASLPAGLTWNTELGVGFKWKDKRVRLTMAQLRLVICLVKSPGKVVPAEDLVDLLDSAGSKKAVATHINGTRERFADTDPHFDQIDNDPGKGYFWRV